ncbi:peptidase, M50 family protein [Flavobacterium undicola]|uniref:peptidase, M50 family protein n=1 Tax=Flavobacterium undicola TaxID=1932779 RepID=UPI001378D522|nr:peptidase, M50 family protein [Flavobacterium undicola]MBA0884772.1 peptidase, M50 family protein [Flavobacterium undicola]
MKTAIVPLLSKEITFHSINKNEYFIHQTVYDHRIKISSELYHFIQLIDNQTELKNIVCNYNLKYKSNITIEFAYDFLYHKLATYGIIQSDEIAIKPNQKPNYIKLNFILISEKIVSKFTQQLHFLFESKISKVIIIVAFLLFAFSFHYYNSQIFHTSLPKSQWLFFFILSFISATFHELGHASAAHHYGAKHGGIGGGFYLFMPVYFADVTDIWKLPKQQRIVVNLAGMYFEIIYVVFLILIGLVFNFPIFIIFGCIILMSSLRNLNPFLRSDGYWVLSDAIEKPNLMTHGFLKIKQFYKSKATWKKMDYFLLSYGLVCYSFILFFLYFVLIKNPDSILYFPQNCTYFIQNLFYENAPFSLAELGKLFIPLLFFYLIFGLAKSFIPLLKKSVLERLRQKQLP